MNILKSILICIATVHSLCAFSQTNSMEAKAAYLLAEEAFEEGKYENCVKYLDEASGKLGTSNAKITYLKVVSLHELFKTDETFVDKLKQALDAFAKAPDLSSFNEEKQMEVMKIKLKVNAYKPPGPTESAAYKYLGVMPGLRVGSFVQTSESTKNAKSVFPESILNTSFWIDAGIINGIAHNYLFFIKLEDQDGDCSKGEGYLKKILQDFGGSPEIKSVSEKSDAKSGTFIRDMKTYNWKENKTEIVLTYTNGRVVGKRTKTCYSLATLKVVPLTGK